MKDEKPDTLHQFSLPLGVSMCLIFACARVLDANEPAPQVSKDGLQSQKQTAQRLVYLKPGATFYPVDIAFTQALKTVSRWGAGCKDIVAAMEGEKQGALPDQTLRATSATPTVSH